MLKLIQTICHQHPTADELFVPTNCLSGFDHFVGLPLEGLIAAGTIVKGSHHCKSPTRGKQDLNLRRT